MLDLNFNVESADPEPFAAAPLLIFKIGIQASDLAAPVHAIALRCQIRIDPARRRYMPSEQERLYELFGRPSQWSQTLRGMLWTHASAIVRAFTGTIVAELPVPCTYDFSVAMTKYFDALEDGQAPLSLLFSGTVFYENALGALQAVPISWEKEASYRLPIEIWRRMIDQHYPNSVSLALRKDVFDRFQQFRISAGHLTSEQALEDLLESAEQKAIS